MFWEVWLGYLCSFFEEFKGNGLFIDSYFLICSIGDGTGLQSIYVEFWKDPPLQLSILHAYEKNTNCIWKAMSKIQTTVLQYVCTLLLWFILLIENNKCCLDQLIIFFFLYREFQFCLKRINGFRIASSCRTCLVFILLRFPVLLQKV